MLAVIFTPSLDSDQLRLNPIRVGRVPATLSTPDHHAILLKDGAPVLRVDVYADRGAECFALEEAIVWHDLVFIGFGNHVHAISVADHSVVSVELGSYFGSFFPATDYLLVASGERIFRVEPDRSICWKTEELAADGVVIRQADATAIQGDGEWDPPSGWKPFTLSAVDGTPVAP